MRSSNRDRPGNVSCFNFHLAIDRVDLRVVRSCERSSTGREAGDRDPPDSEVFQFQANDVTWPAVACVCQSTKLGMHSVWTYWNKEEVVFSRRSWFSLIVGVRRALVRSYDHHLPEVFLWLNFTPDPRQVHAERFSFSYLAKTPPPFCREYGFKKFRKLRTTPSLTSLFSCRFQIKSTRQCKLIDLGRSYRTMRERTSSSFMVKCTWASRSTSLHQRCGCSRAYRGHLLSNPALHSQLRALPLKNGRYLLRKLLGTLMTAPNVRFFIFYTMLPCHKCAENEGRYCQTTAWLFMLLNSNFTMVPGSK